MADKPGKVTTHLTPAQARIIFLLLDGVADAGACKDGLEQREKDAINEFGDQILKGLTRINPKSPLAGK